MISVLLLLSAIFALSGNPAQASTLNHAGFPNPLTVNHRDSLTLRSEKTQQINARAEVATQQDADGDGLPDITTLSTSFHTPSDQIIVVDGAQNMEWSDDVNLATDFTDDVWIFDVGADGTAQLIVTFATEGPQHTALVYDDFNGDGQISYRIEGDQVTIDETQFWHVKVETDQGWAEPWNGATGKSTFLIDGYDGLGYGAGGPPGNRDAGRNGVIDWQVEVNDKSSDGINDYQLRRATSPSLIEYRNAALHKTVINAQTTDRRPVPYDDAGIWPLLIGKHRWEDYRYFDHFPAIAVDWEVGAIDQIGVLGFPIEAGYHIFSRLPLEKHTVNSADFENPMAYYDMANDADGWPELQVRFDLKVPYDPSSSYPYAGQVNTPNAEVNYSWDQDNDNRWDYKINLASNYLVDDVVEFPDFAVKSVPYDEIIPWVRDRTWDVAMLVFDSRPSPDSEGMYGKGWMVNRGYAAGKMVEPSGVSTRYLMGLSDSPPAETYQDIQEGMRGEYSFEYLDTPKMYLSALDRQLHLSGAQKGVWNLGEDYRLRYDNLDADAYLDQWREEREGTVVQQLNYSDGVYVYSGNDKVLIKQTDLSPALVETQPPGDYEEWQRLEAQLKAHQTALAPEDFLGMLDQLTGSDTLIQSATARDYRVTAQGFRFILELQPGFSLSLDQTNLAPMLEAPGSYVVEYDGQGWAARPSVPVLLRFSDLQVTAQSGGLQALRWAEVEAQVRNEGLEDGHNLPICAKFEGPAGTQIVMTDTLGLLPAETQQLVKWDWAPPAAGTWKVRVAANCGDSADGTSGEQMLSETTVEISDRGKPSVGWLISLGRRVPAGSIALALLATLTLASVAAIVWTKELGP